VDGRDKPGHDGVRACAAVTLLPASNARLRADSMADSIEQRDFFISFNGADLAYAEAIDAALRAAGFSTFYHPRDLPPGGNIPIWMDDALMNSAQTLALYSPAYTSDKAVYSKAERYASWWDDPDSKKRKLIPVVLNQTSISPIMKMISYIDVTGRNPKDAASHVVMRLKAPGESAQRDELSPAGGQVFNVIYRPNPNFTGRFEALESLQQALRQGTNAAVTAVAGMGGIGKTTLAAEYCHRFRWRYAGVWWIRAEQQSIMLADLQTLGQKVGVASGENIEADARATLEHLSGLTESWLLVYDNAPNPDAIAKWLPLGSVRCIITSRFTEFGALAPVTRLDQWSNEITAEYLLSRTRRDDTAGAARLAHRLGGLPLAAEQAVGFLSARKGIGFDEYGAEIGRLIKRKRDAGIAGEYPDTVYAAFVKSLEALQQQEGGDGALDVLRLCAFLSPDGVELELLTAEVGVKILPASLALMLTEKFAREDALGALVSLSLLREEKGPFGPILIFHRLLLEVCREWIGEEGRVFWGSAAAELISEVLPLGTSGGRGDPSTDPSVWPLYARLMPHVAPLEAHVARVGTAGPALVLLFNRTSLYLSSRGDQNGAKTHAEGAVALARDLDADPLTLATYLNNLAAVYVDLNRLDEAERVFTEVLTIAEAHLPADDPRLAMWIGNLGTAHRKRNAFEKAEPLLLRSAEIFKAADGSGSASYGVALGNLDSLYDDWAEYSGDLAKRRTAEHYSAQALAVTRGARGTRHPSTAVRHYNFGVLRQRMGDGTNAAVELTHAVAIMLSLDLAEHPNMQVMAEWLSAIWRQSGHADKATRLKEGDLSNLLPGVAQIGHQQSRQPSFWPAVLL
jgi:tetratricopeptide (TPR) repeat protein